VAAARAFDPLCYEKILRILIWSGGRHHSIKTGKSQGSYMPDQAQKTRPLAPGSGGGNDGPNEPKIEKPNTEELLKRMRKVDPDQAKRYRQRTGQ
jgi:hypothetical protein